MNRLAGPTWGSLIPAGTWCNETGIWCNETYPDLPIVTSVFSLSMQKIPILFDLSGMTPLCDGSDDGGCRSLRAERRGAGMDDTDTSTNLDDYTAVDCGTMIDCSTNRCDYCIAWIHRLSISEHDVLAGADTSMCYEPQS